eukprot:TRINITY_DN5559_c0_g1_i1.p1 TRINITY_DN5559_c0_g1~~TRINITY_DN5559_c0_g1_i1.p1  ORF type:complete len:199 (+),score=69.24 TRINITY_DN5559_c0_g1_i1:300-896(+)
MTKHDLEQIGIRREDRGVLLRQNRKLRQQVDAQQTLKELLLITEAGARKEAKKEAWIRLLMLKREEQEKKKEHEALGEQHQRRQLQKMKQAVDKLTKPTRQMLKASDRRCRFAPISLGCNAAHCQLTCVHCGNGFCPNCLWSEAGRLRSPLECCCGMPPRSMPSAKPRSFSPRNGSWLTRDTSLFGSVKQLPQIKGPP